MKGIIPAWFINRRPYIGSQYSRRANASVPVKLSRIQKIVISCTYPPKDHCSRCQSCSTYAIGSRAALLLNARNTNSATSAFRSYLMVNMAKIMNEIPSQFCWTKCGLHFLQRNQPKHNYLYSKHQKTNLWTPESTLLLLIQNITITIEYEFHTAKSCILPERFPIKYQVFDNLSHRHTLGQMLPSHWKRRLKNNIVTQYRR